MGGVLRGGNRDMLQPSEKVSVEREKKNIPEILFLFSLFARGSEFLYRWKRVKLQLYLAWYDNTMKNQDVTWTGPVECLVLFTTV